LKFDVVVSKFDEDLDKSQFPSAADYAKATATAKALEVANRLEIEDKTGATPFMIVGSDTVVEAPDGSIMEKPADEEAAMKMLLSLQGVTHQVHSGVGIVFPDPARTDGVLVKSFAETTRVTFASLQEAEMRAYIKTGEPFDKAGGYGA
jgi:septum formation protein|tara:strand:- start:183 stop:629 length:447 start_codon:yes stop_codon:yes gene_type:complete